MGLFGEKMIDAMIISLVDEKDKIVSEYKVDLSHFDIDPEAIEDLVETIFKGNWLD